MKDLQPRAVWQYFEEITQVPRPSKKEEKIIAYLQAFAAEHGLKQYTDQIGNVIIFKDATAGNEAKDALILQAHVDMVCEKNADVEHDFENDPIQTYVDGDWLKARGTTLGADNGIGMAMMLAVLAADDLAHPALECVFTVDEETGLTGAFALEDGVLKGKSLINLDSEDDGEIFIGCAGGIDTMAKFKAEYEAAPAGYFAATVVVKGLKGGHSGCDIHLGLGNANKILNRYLYKVNAATDLRIAHMDGGNLRNAIAREAQATVCVPMKYKEQLRIDLNVFVAEIENEIGKVEPGFVMELETEELPQKVFTKALSDKLILAIYACPHGVFAMSNDMPGLVETSTNLASVKVNDGMVELNTSQRSSIESAKYDIMNMVDASLAIAGADEVSHGDGYPGWKPNVDSRLLGIAQKAYTELTGKEAKVLAIHAGLECGLFLKKYPYLDMISIGPAMQGVHSPTEKLSISSTARCWEWLKLVISY